MKKQRVFLLCPQVHGEVRWETAQAIMLEATDGRVEVDFLGVRGSLLARNCNLGWCEALRRAERGEADFFAILHADVAPQKHWVVILLEEQAATGADLLGAVVPLKDEKGGTSTAIDHAQSDWLVEKRLWMAEIMQLPETFTAADCGYPDRCLLLNTGCLLVDIRTPKLRQTNPDGTAKLFFTINDLVVKVEDRWETLVESEDWNFSRRAFRLGAKIAATRKVHLYHFGEAPWPNVGAWGVSQSDPQQGKQLVLFPKEKYKHNGRSETTNPQYAEVW